MRRRGGFSLIEAFVAMALVALGLLMLLTVFLMALRHATETRDHALALVLAENLRERIEDHPYGLERPATWGSEASPTEQEYVVVVEGRQVVTRFAWSIDTAPPDQGGNGSFFGKDDEIYDVLRIRVSWTDGTGPASEGQGHTLVREATVWQQGVPAATGGGS